MSKTSNKQRLDVLQGWVSYVSKQKGYPKAKIKARKEFDN